MDEQTARREIVNIGRLLYERSYVVSSDGNVSVRLDDGRIVATPTMMCKGRMTEDSLAVTDATGKPFDRLETLEHTARIAILARILGGSKNLPADAIEKLINVREAAGYLGENARCQACGYLHETQLSCPTGDRPAPTSYTSPSSRNGSGKISLTREELVELLAQALTQGRPGNVW